MPCELSKGESGDGFIDDGGEKAHLFEVEISADEWTYAKTYS